MDDQEFLASLLPETREALDFDLEGKLDYMDTHKFIPYPKAVEILDAMERCLKGKRKPHMPSYVVSGDSHNGKTSLIHEFMLRHPPTNGMDSDPLEVIAVEAPREPNVDSFYDRILDKIAIPYRKSNRWSHKEHLIKEHVPRVGTRMLIVDEIHNILNGSATRRGSFMSAVKGLSNELDLNIIVFGISTAVLAISTDDQMRSRFRPLSLPKWKLDEEYANLLASLELTLPFRRHPGLSTNPDLAIRIYDMSEGILGYIVEIVNLCAAEALRKGNDRITMDDLKAIKFIPLSEERALQEL